MYTIRLLTVIFLMTTFGFGQSDNLPTKQHPPIDRHEDWSLAMQLWTFNKYTFLEALDKTASLGISWVEAYPGQKLSPDLDKAVFNHNMPADQRALVKSWLKERGLHLVNYGVVALPNDEQECRKVFNFARDMGIQTLASEPPDEAWDLVEKLCDEYGINVAIHNHPNPSHYWNPKKVLEVSEGRSKHIGACADIGHWMRSGIQPLEALRLLEGRIISFHFGDLNAFGDKKAHDVPWGTGVADLSAILREMKRQQFKGVISVEYEYNWTASVPEVRQSVQFFNNQVGQLFSPDFKNLLADDLSNCLFTEDSWSYVNGVLSARGGGDIWTKERYGNFILDLEFKLAENTNSGVFVRTDDVVHWLHTAIEIQVLDSYGNKEISKHDCGAIFDCLAPAVNAVKPAGQWNRYTIICYENKINVVLNGQAIIDMDLNQWTEAHKNPDGTPNKFNTAYKDMAREGHIGLQYHGHPVWYRNIRIKEL